MTHYRQSRDAAKAVLAQTPDDAAARENLARSETEIARLERASLEGAGPGQ